MATLARAISIGCCLLGLWGCDSAGFKRAYMALDPGGDRRRERFYTDTEAIYCVVEMASGRDDVTVSARVRAHELFLPPNGESVPVDLVIGVGEEAPGRGDDLLVSFRLEKDAPSEPYLAGRYSCDLYLDGDFEESVAFDIVYPACPVPPAVDGTVCEGYFLPGATCPGVASGSSCVCDTAGTWLCS
jgi:hypothetical protein